MICYCLCRYIFFILVVLLCEIFLAVMLLRRRAAARMSLRMLFAMGDEALLLFEERNVTSDNHYPEEVLKHHRNMNVCNFGASGSLHTF